METFIPMDSTKLTNQERVQTLSSLFFWVEKSNVRVKSRGCDDGQEKRNKISKEDAASPTVALGRIMITQVIQDRDQRDIFIINIQGAYLHT